MNNTICPVCNFSIQKERVVPIVYPKKGRLKSSFELVYFCPGCHVGIAAPTLSDDQIDQLYIDGDYWNSQKGQDLSPHMFPGQYAMAECRICFLEKFTHKGKPISILDVGAGHGFLGESAYISSGFCLGKYAVVEKDRHYREALTNVWKDRSKIEFKAWEDVKDATGNFDLIIFSHVLEHVNSPKSMLQQAAALLNEGGLLLVDVPHQDYIFKEDVFPHVLFYSPSNLRTLIEKSDLKVVAMECFGRSRKQLSHGSISVTLRKNLEQFVYKLRSILPPKFTKRFFLWYFRGDKPNTDGVWIRAVLKKV